MDKLREFRNHLQLRKTQSQNRMISKSYLRAVRGWVDHTQNLHDRPRWICFRTLCLIGSRSDSIHFSLGMRSRPLREFGTGIGPRSSKIGSQVGKIRHLQGSVLRCSLDDLLHPSKQLVSRRSPHYVSSISVCLDLTRLDSDDIGH